MYMNMNMNMNIICILYVTPVAAACMGASIFSIVVLMWNHWDTRLGKGPVHLGGHSGKTPGNPWGKTMKKTSPRDQQKRSIKNK